MEKEKQLELPQEEPVEITKNPEEGKDTVKLLNEEKKGFLPKVSSSKELSYDEVLNELGYGKYQYLIFLMMGLIGIGDGAQQQALSILLPILQKEWNFQENAGEFLGSFHFFGVLIGSLLAGPLSDKYGRKSQLVISACLTILVPIIQTFLYDIWGFIILRGIYGALIGFIIPISFTMLAENIPTKNRGKFLTLIGLNIAVGEFFTILLAKATLTNLTAGYWRIMLISSGFPVLISLILMLIFLNESIRWDLLFKNYNTAFYSISVMAKMNGHLDTYLTEEKKLMIKNWAEKTNKTEKKEEMSNWQLFRGSFKFITPIIWFSWVVNNLVYFGALFTLPKTLVLLGLQQENYDSLTDFSTLAFGVLGTVPSPIVAAIVVDIKHLGRKNSLSLTFLFGKNFFITSKIFCLFEFFFALFWKFAATLTILF